MINNAKFEALKKFIGQYESAVIAFSGGVDSTFLACVAQEVLKNKVLLVTATSSTYPFYELAEAKETAAFLKAPHRVIVSEEIDIPGFSNNPPDRCYYCKSELFIKIKHIAQQENFAVVFEGSNADDLKDYRPGMKAVSELGIISPLRQAGLTKAEIRAMSLQLGLPTSNKPAYACLASRFPYGEQITKEKLDRVGNTEYEIRSLGFGQFRVRSHETLARLEFAPDEMDKAWQMKDKLNEICKKSGFTFCSIDLSGYRTGAMNEMLNLEK